MQGLTTTQQTTSPVKENASFTKSVHQARSFNSDGQANSEVFTLVQIPFNSALSLTEHKPVVDDNPHATKSNEQQVSDDTQQELTMLVPPTVSIVQETTNPESRSNAQAQGVIVAGFNFANGQSTQGRNITGSEAGALNNQISVPQATNANLLQTPLTNPEVNSRTSNTPVADIKLVSAINSELSNIGASQLDPTAQSAPLHSSSTTNVTTVENRPEWATVRIDTQAGKWGEQMLQVLHDRVTLQAQQNLQEAKIRLDPPDLGKLDLVVRIEGDRLSVQINANSAATREALVQVSDRLRTELQEQNFVNVDVNVGSDQRNQQQSQTFEEQNGRIYDARETSSDQEYTPTSEHWLSAQA
ncbi:flagellar hook-length control protein FliK [Vibrio sp. Y2-5]|uniref:flagellar hook-length control protein FliK n=1 Tax=Vibrio sp. Y2-5 TaxID=2743977 RepID=UPI001CB74073|nr:flagellar hook-length control protein FliK [Vibrio sp. Y2-5]